MRKIVLLLIFIFSLSFANAGKKALLVGISKYPHDSGWCKLSSNNDLNYLDSILKCNFKTTIICNEQATKVGIIKALQKLERQVLAGDTILVHFSGHGQQMWANNDNENDLLDEAFVPYDAQKDSSAIYRGQNHLRDDELGTKINEIRKKAGTNGLVIVTIDACHSGSIDRDPEKNESIVRGTFDIFGAKRTMEDDARFKQPDDTTRIKKGTLADVVYISACAQYEINREILVEGLGYGSLSYSLGEALESTSLEDKISFVNAVIDNMALNQPMQSPKIRASFDYKDNKGEKLSLASFNDNDLSQRDSSSYIILIIFLVIVSIIGCVVWIRMKKK